MAKLVWDATGSRLYETGVKNCVLYPMSAQGTYPTGVAWNGVTAITEKPTGAEATALYADDIKYLNLISAEEFEATIEAYTYPDEFQECIGEVDLGSTNDIGMVIGQQARKTFGICYRTAIGNDVNNDSHGYKIHIIYGCLAAPSERAYQTINDSPEAITMSWDVKTTPVNVTGFKPTAYVCIDSTKADAAKLATLLDTLYGTDGSGSGTGTTASLPLPDAIKATLS